MNRIRRVKRLNRDIFVTKTYKWMATGLLLLITIPIVLAVPAIEIKFKNMRTIDDLYPDYKIADVINDDLIVTIPTEYEEKSVNNKKIRVNKNLKEEKIKYSDINIGTGYGIHGTNDEWSIVKNASMGCIRLLNDDIKELYEMVPTGIPVWIGHTETLEKWGLYKVSK